MHQSEPYYSRVASNATAFCCKARTIGVEGARKLASRRDLFSPEVKDLNPNLVFVTTNSVQLSIGQGLASYSISWSQSDDGKMWRLDAYAEGFGKVVYTKKK